MTKSLAVLLSAAALLAACGDDDGDADDATTTTAASEPDQRIVSLSATATEMLYAIGAGDLVVAVDDQSDYPEGVPTTDLSAIEPNVEAIATYEPDLVVLSGGPEDVVAGLEAIGADVLILEAAVTLDDTYAQIAELGVVTGHEDEAADVNAEIRADIDDLVSQVPLRDALLTYYHELTSDLYSVTSSTFIGQLYSLAGMRSIADVADPNGEFGGYPQLSAEYVVDADPDFIFLADTECCGESADSVEARPGFANLRAITESRVVEVSDDIASRWGPRVVDVLRIIVEATSDVPVG